MTWAARLALVAAALYGAVLILVYTQQRRLLYAAFGPAASAAEAGLDGFEDVVLATADGERIAAWWRPAAPGRATLLYFHGNGGGLLNRRDRARLLTADGRGLLLVTYRGYPGSTGTPTETGLREDARAAYAWVASRVEPRGLVLYGESLGGGVAVGLAVERPVGGLVLDAPFTSAADVAKRHYRFLPVDWLMLDQFRSLDRIAALRAPLLVLHGARDGVVPIAMGERLFAAAPEPKRFVRLAGGHESNLEGGGLEAVRAFLDAVERGQPG